MRASDKPLLRALRSSSMHLPLGELAKLSGMASEVAAIRIEELQQAGYDIEAQPHLGYRLLSAPDRLVADDLEAMVQPGVIGGRILVFEETASTNDTALALGADGAEDGLVVFAERQTRGRGRHGRHWSSAAHKGLWFSMLLRPQTSPAHWSRLTLVLALAIAEVLQEHAGCRARIKWPNDVLVENRKLAGILTESRIQPKRTGYVVAGVGLNVNQAVEDFPRDLREIAGSAAMVSGAKLNRSRLAVAIIDKLNLLYPAALDSDVYFRDVLARYSALSCVLGRWLRVGSPGAEIEGVAEALDENGGLIIRTADGRAVSVTAGEVSVLDWAREGL